MFLGGVAAPSQFAEHIVKERAIRNTERSSFWFFFIHEHFAKTGRLGIAQPIADSKSAITLISRSSVVG